MQSLLKREAETEQTFQWQDQRNGLRQMPRRTLLFIEHPEHGKIEVVMIDLSRKGMRLRSTQKLHCGDTMTVFPPKGADLEPLTIRIVRAQLTEKTDRLMFEYGAHLTEPSRVAGHAWFLHFCYGGKKEQPLPQG